MLSFQILFIVTLVFSGTYVFVIVYPFTFFIYPSGTFVSSTVYIISCPSEGSGTTSKSGSKSSTIIYLELPETLEDYLDYCNTSLYIEVEDLSNKLSEQLNKLVDTYLKMEKIYEDLNVDDVKSKA